MKRNFIKALLLGSIILAACSDSDVITTKSETPLGTYMATVTAGSVEEYTDGSTYSVGYSFVPKKAGTIIALGVSAPQVGTYTISLYDDTDVLLASTTAEITELQLTENPYAFSYGDLTEAVQVEANQLLHVVYDMNVGTEKIYRPVIDPFTFQMEKSFIEFKGGVWGYPGAAPTVNAEATYYTADIKIKY